MRVAVDDGLSPVRLRNFRPEHHGYRAPLVQELACRFVIVGLGRKGQMVVLRPRRVIEQSFHSRRNLRVVEELDFGKFSKQFGVKPFPREVTGAVEPYGWDKSKSSGFFFQAAYFDGQHL